MQLFVRMTFSFCAMVRLYYEVVGDLQRVNLKIRNMFLMLYSYRTRWSSLINIKLIDVKIIFSLGQKSSKRNLKLFPFNQTTAQVNGKTVTVRFYGD